MGKLTLRYNYTNEYGEKMVYVCQAEVSRHSTMGMASRTVREKLESLHGPITDFFLAAQNNPVDIEMLKLMGTKE